MIGTKTFTSKPAPGNWRATLSRYVYIGHANEAVALSSALMPTQLGPTIAENELSFCRQCYYLSNANLSYWTPGAARTMMVGMLSDGTDLDADGEYKTFAEAYSPSIFDVPNNYYNVFTGDAMNQYTIEYYNEVEATVRLPYRLTDPVTPLAASPSNMFIFGVTPQVFVYNFSGAPGHPYVPAAYLFRLNRGGFYGYYGPPICSYS